MNHKIICTTLTICLTSLLTMTQAAESFVDNEMGLSKNSVFDDPTPEPFKYKGGMPGDNAVYQRAYPGSPPQIPHNIEFMTPVKSAVNYCLSCHGRSEDLSKPLQGKPTQIPASHYTDLRHTPNKVGKELVGARYVCTQCHVPQADVEPLIKNKF